MLKNQPQSDDCAIKTGFCPESAQQLRSGKRRAILWKRSDKMPAFPQKIVKESIIVDCFVKAGFSGAGRSPSGLGL
ncbi:MAG: hypothetical protein SOW06_06045 [Succinivibrionaceae bacterium]|jgi:hypothetical protein|nr:hypothetical protein [Succinivibrionaceae bacterium]MCI6200505.1 hypothetical protein [Pseudomonadota bacterium]MDY3144907.1 hypothetical protein [Succinivibrionaceae bacterium]MDY6274492.1 hypothetical protein [Succinivibrionaceae bacterium]